VFLFRKHLFLFRKSLFTVIMAPKHKSSDAGDASKPKRSRDVLSISEKVKILVMMEIEKKLFAEIARLCGKNESSTREVMKDKEKISLLYCLLRIRLKCQNPLLSYVQERERESTLYMYNVVHSTLYYYFI